MKIKCYIIISVLIFILLSGCTSKIKEPENRSLKVLTFNASGFNATYGNFFFATHPNVTLSVISIAENLQPGTNINMTIVDLLEKENPDVVVLSQENISYLKSQNKLVSLSDYIKKNDVDVSDYTPAVRSLLIDDQNNYYGLTPTFVGSALYYNKKLFNNNGIEYPTNGLTWDDLFQLSQRFIKENNNEFAFYDKSYENPFMMAMYIGEGSGLSFYQNKKFTFNTNAWEKIFTNVVTCIKTEACYKKQEAAESKPLKGVDIVSLESENYPFLRGNIAMAVDDSNLYVKLTTNKERYKDIDWGLVTLPVSPENPDLGNRISLDHIFSIPQDSHNKDVAWELIEYINGKDFERVLPYINHTDLPVRRNSADDNENISLDPFYMLGRANETVINELRDLPKSVIMRMDESSTQNLADVKSGEISVREALEKINMDLQVALTQAEGQK